MALQQQQQQQQQRRQQQGQQQQQQQQQQGRQVWQLLWVRVCNSSAGNATAPTLCKLYEYDIKLQ